MRCAPVGQEHDISLSGAYLGEWAVGIVARYNLWRMAIPVFLKILYPVVYGPLLMILSPSDALCHVLSLSFALESPDDRD
jgi:hypothetical protein